MQSLCPFVVPFLAAEEMLLNVHACPTLIFFKGLKFYARHLLCVKSLSSDNSRIVSILFFFIVILVATAQGASRRMQLTGLERWGGWNSSPSTLHQAVPCQAFSCHASLELPCAGELEENSSCIMGANNVEVQCEKHLSPRINTEMYFF